MTPILRNGCGSVDDGSRVALCAARHHAVEHDEAVPPIESPCCPCSCEWGAAGQNAMQVRHLRCCPVEPIDVARRDRERYLLAEYIGTYDLKLQDAPIGAQENVLTPFRIDEDVNDW